MMVYEAIFMNISRLGLEVRLWKFHFLCSMRKSTTGLIIDDFVLNLGSEHYILNRIKVVYHSSQRYQRLTRFLVQYTHNISALNRALR
jgi:hypothetical protein